MTVQVNDPKLIEQLLRAGEVVDLIGPDGEPFGQFSTFRHDLPPGFKLPYTDAEIDEMRKDLTGVSFDEMWREIRAREHS